MNEELSFSMTTEASNIVIEKKFTSPMWNELNSLLIKDEQNITKEESELTRDVNDEIDEFLQRIIVRELKRLFDINEKPLIPFIEKLNGKDGKEQIIMIDNVFKGDPLFWDKVELDLVDECINPLINDLKISIATEYQMSHPRSGTKKGSN